MSLFDRIRKKAGTASPAQVDSPKPKTTVAKTELKRDPARAVSAPAAAPSREARAGVYAHRILLRPVISEKTAHLHEYNQYVFEVHPRANKISVKRAIFEMYKVMPTRVRILTVAGRSVVRGRVRGKTSDYKKAVISLPKGSKLPIYEGV